MSHNKFKHKLFDGDRAYSTVISFGDSLTDNGNTYKKSFEVVPNKDTWYKGRFSNDKVWVEYLCSYSKDKNCKLIDKAYGGAYSKDGYQDIKLDDKSLYKLITNFYKQVENFTNNTDDYDPDTTLYTMDIGGNDIMELKTGEYDIADNVDKAIALLVQKKKAKYIALLNLPDFSKAPRYIKATKEKRREIHKEIVKANKEIKAVAKKYQDKGIDIEIIDFYSLMNILLVDDNHISDKPCLDIPLKTDKLDFLMNYKRTKNCRANIDKYICFDNLHPTNSTHQKLAELTSHKF